MRPLTTYMPFKDFNLGGFVFMKPHDHDLVLLWIGKTEGDAIKDEESEHS
jgi:hypothetical protein